MKDSRFEADLVDFISEVCEIEGHYERLLAIRQGLEAHIMHQASLLMLVKKRFEDSGFQHQNRHNRSMMHSSLDSSAHLHDEVQQIAFGITFSNSGNHAQASAPVNSLLAALGSSSSHQFRLSQDASLSSLGSIHSQLSLTSSLFPELAAPVNKTRPPASRGMSPRGLESRVVHPSIHHNSMYPTHWAGNEKVGNTELLEFSEKYVHEVVH